MFLWIGTIQSKTNSPETLNPRGFQRGVPFGRRKRKEGFGEERYSQRSFKANLFCRGVLPPLNMEDFMTKFRTHNKKKRAAALITAAVLMKKSIIVQTLNPLKL
ncbi:hypothetical protein E4N80_12445 [Treponema denticola]|nr:hypothetical protein E4N80_12445 [Treponema denticola]